MNQRKELDGPGGPQVAIGKSWYQAAIVETVGTFFLVFTIFGVAVDNRGEGKLCGLLIGGMLSAQILAISGISGCALNPTRFFGPVIGALLVGRGFRGGPYNPSPIPTEGGNIVYWENNGSFLVYFFPFLGALIGAFSYQYCFLDNQEPELDGDEDTEKLKI
jgi:glycerol uptake facilitator-like aquaporin